MPVMEGMHDMMMPGDPQIMENVLQVRQPDGSFKNEAAPGASTLPAGAGRASFGDLDNDGWLDLYVVNGMAAEELFSHLPGNELVEENQAFRNDGGKRFVPQPQWGLDATAGGRGMSMADLDDDGDLDIVVNNLMAPAVVFENQLCAGAGLEVDLRWPDGEQHRGLGAHLTLHTSTGTLARGAAVAGYASGDPAARAFRLPSHGSDLLGLDIRWPDGAISSVSEPKPDTRLTVTRSQGGEDCSGATNSVCCHRWRQAPAQPRRGGYGAVESRQRQLRSHPQAAFRQLHRPVRQHLAQAKRIAVAGLPQISTPRYLRPGSI